MKKEKLQNGSDRSKTVINKFVKIQVNIKVKSQKELVEKIKENTFLVAVKEPPVGGKANAGVIKALARYFKIPQARVRIVSGHKSKQKIVEINL